MLSCDDYKFYDKTKKQKKETYDAPATVCAFIVRSEADNYFPK